MSRVKYKLKIKGLKSPHGTIPLSALTKISQVLLEGSERSLRLSIEGISKKNYVPKWLKRSLNFTITGLSPGCTVVEIEAPTLYDTAPDQIQKDIWQEKPEIDDTALSMFAKSIIDAKKKKLDSNRFDQDVLDSILSFGSIQKNNGFKIDLISDIKPDEDFSLDNADIQKIENMKAVAPDPRAVVLSGIFDSILHKKKGFILILENNKKIPGEINSAYVDKEQMRKQWGEKVTIKGSASFKPSGEIQFIKADVIKPFEPGEEIFQIEPQVEPIQSVIKEFERKQQLRSPLMEIWGKWPGDETIEEILDMLDEMN